MKEFGGGYISNYSQFAAHVQGHRFHALDWRTDGY